jgi:Putative binding domain, N-terminal/Viral BACON domain
VLFTDGVSEAFDSDETTENGDVNTDGRGLSVCAGRGVRLRQWGGDWRGDAGAGGERTLPSASRILCVPRKIARVALAAGALLSTTCGSSSETQTFSAPSALRCAVRIEPESATFPPSGGSGTVGVSTNRDCTWTAKPEAPWVTLSAGEGQGGGSVQFTVASNGDPLSRSTGIVVNDQRLQIAQEGKPCQFTLSSNRESVDGNGGEATVQVRATAAQCGWTASANVPWITIFSGHDGRGDGAVRFRVGPVDGSPRTGTLTIAGQTVHVDQGTGCSYSIGTETVSVDPSGGDRQVPVSAASGCPWSAESNSVWITITSGRTGNGPGTVGFRVSASDGPRTGTLSVAGRIVTVVQSAGCSFSVTPPNLNAGAGGGSSTIHVETASGCTWSAALDVPWITVSGAAGGNGRGDVQFVVAANAGPARTGSLTIAGQKIGIAQASGCTYAVFPAAQQFAPSGGSAVASVSTATGCPWSATSGANWIAMTTPSGSGSGQATFAVASNQGAARTGTLTIAGQSHTITQASSCTWSFNPPFHEMPVAGGFGTVLVFVTGPCTWTATSTVDWVRVVAGASGTGGGMVQFTIAANSGRARTGVIVIGSESYEVRQHGAQ